MEKCVSQFNIIYRVYIHIFQSVQTLWKIMMEYAHTYNPAKSSDEI